MVEARPQVSEFGPWLGVVAGPRPRPAPGQISLDTARMTLLGRLLDEAHRPAPDWLAPWTQVTETVAAQVVDSLRVRAAAAAAASHAPERVARIAHLGDDDVRIVQARIASTGIPLEQAVAALPAGAAFDRAFPAVGGAVEESWLGLERMVATVVGEWAPHIATVATWRRPTTPLWIGTAVALTGAILLGLVVGGYLPAPGWFQPVVAWWWSLPWP